jgi:hypothetical protein
VASNILEHTHVDRGRSHRDYRLSQPGYVGRSEMIAAEHFTLLL